MRKIKIADATQPELVQFARINLGLPVHPNTGKENVIAKIKECFNGEELTLADEVSQDAPQGDAPRPATPAQNGPRPGYVRVLIPIVEGKSGKDDVPLGSNGKQMLVPRGKEVDIRYTYYESLKNAKAARYEMQEDGKSMNPIPTEVQEIPFSVIAFGEMVPDPALVKPKKAA